MKRAGHSGNVDLCIRASRRRQQQQTPPAGAGQDPQRGRSRRPAGRHGGHRPRARASDAAAAPAEAGAGIPRRHLAVHLDRPRKPRDDRTADRDDDLHPKGTTPWTSAPKGSRRTRGAAFKESGTAEWNEAQKTLTFKEKLSERRGDFRRRQLDVAARHSLREPAGARRSAIGPRSSEPTRFCRRRRFRSPRRSRSTADRSSASATARSAKSQARRNHKRKRAASRFQPAALSPFTRLPITRLLSILQFVKSQNSHCVPNRIVRPARIAVGFIQVRVAGMAP